MNYLILQMSLKGKKLYRFADQLRGSGMSMSNNISEGSGSSSKKEFRRFLDIARRSTFENANIVVLLEMRKLITIETLDSLLDRLDSLCRQVTSFQNSLWPISLSLCSMPYASPTYYYNQHLALLKYGLCIYPTTIWLKNPFKSARIRSFSGWGINT